MTPEDYKVIEKLLNLADTTLKVGLGALAAYLAAKVTAKKALETRVLDHTQENKKTIYERDSAIYKDLMLAVENLDNSLDSLSDSTIESMVYKQGETDLLERMKQNEASFRTSIKDAPALVQKKAIAEFTKLGSEAKLGMKKKAVEAAGNKATSIRLLSNGMSKITATAMLTGNSRIIESTDAFISTSKGIFSQINDRSATEDVLTSIDYSIHKTAKNILNIAISEEFRSLLSHNDLDNGSQTKEQLKRES